MNTLLINMPPCPLHSEIGMALAHSDDEGIITLAEMLYQRCQLQQYVMTSRMPQATDELAAVGIKIPQADYLEIIANSQVFKTKCKKFGRKDLANALSFYYRQSLYLATQLMEKGLCSYT